MTHDALALTTYFGERDRDGGRLLADALMQAYARRGLRASVLLRGTAGFGVKHHLRTDRLLTLSEDLPLVAIAVDRPEPVLAAAEEAAARSGRGLITLERASLGGAPPGAGEVKLTVHLGRGARAAGRPAHVALVDLLHRRGVAGASVLLGVDGTAHGRRRRARFAGANGHVPLIVVSVGDAARIGAALPELDALLGEPLRTLERVRVCKRDGVRLAEPHDVAENGAGVWRKLTVICGEQSRHAGRPLADALIARPARVRGGGGDRRCAGSGATTATTRRTATASWQLRRRVPVIVTTVDTPERSRRSFGVIDALHRRRRPRAVRARSRLPRERAGIVLGALELAGPPDRP